MDFVVRFPRTQTSHNAIWVIVDRLNKLAHFLAIHSTFSLERLASLYINEIVNLVEYWYKLCQIGILDSHLDFGQNYRRLWVLSCTSALLSILKLMVNLKGPSKYWKTCFRHVYWSLKIVGCCIYLRLSLLTTTVIRLVLAWLPTRLFIRENVGLLSIGMRSMKGN